VNRHRFLLGERANLPEFRSGQIWEAKKRTPYDSTYQLVLDRPHKAGWWFLKNNDSGMTHENFLRKYYYQVDKRLIRTCIFTGERFYE
jgi:hypothetical protein